MTFVGLKNILQDMVERSISRPREFIQKIKEKPLRDKLFLAAEAAALVFLGMYVFSTVSLTAMERYEEAKESGLDTLRMAAVTAIIYGIDKYTKSTNFLS